MTTKEFKAADRARRRTIRARLTRTKGTDKSGNRKPGVKYSAKPATFKGKLFRHAKPCVASPNEIPLRAKYLR